MIYSKSLSRQLILNRLANQMPGKIFNISQLIPDSGIRI